MGTDKNIKLHIVTDIKIYTFLIYLELNWQSGQKKTYFVQRNG